MTAAIAGITFVEAGQNTHVRRYRDGRPYWHCARYDGPCEGHGPVTAAPNSTTNSGARWCPKGLHQGEMKPRADKPNAMVCRGCERDRERARRSPAYDSRRKAA